MNFLLICMCIHTILTSTILKNLLSGYARTKQDFDYWFGKAVADPLHRQWIRKVPRSKWTQLFDGEKRYGQMTTNLSECTNKVLIGTRHLPVTALVKSTYYRLAELFDRRCIDAHYQQATGHDGHRCYCNKLVKICRT